MPESSLHSAVTRLSSNTWPSWFERFVSFQSIHSIPFRFRLSSVEMETSKTVLLCTRARLARKYVSYITLRRFHTILFDFFFFYFFATFTFLIEHRPNSNDDDDERGASSFPLSIDNAEWINIIWREKRRRKGMKTKRKKEKCAQSNNSCKLSRTNLRRTRANKPANVWECALVVMAVVVVDEDDERPRDVKDLECAIENRKHLHTHTVAFAHTKHSNESIFFYMKRHTGFGGCDGFLFLYFYVISIESVCAVCSVHAAHASSQVTSGVIIIINCGIDSMAKDNA